MATCKQRLVKFAVVTVSPLLCAASILSAPVANPLLPQPELPRLEQEEVAESTASTHLTARETELLAQGQIPEEQLWFPNYPTIHSPIAGTFRITGGFMEPQGHAPKGELWAIFQDQPNRVQLLPPSRRNIGWDLVITDATLGNPNVHPEAVRNWFASTVTWQGFVPGYGWQLEARLAQPFQFNGKPYTVHIAYSHGAEQFYANPGETLEPGQVIGRMGGTGWDTEAYDYAPHSDMKLWIVLEDGRQVYISPNLLIEQLGL